MANKNKKPASYKKRDYRQLIDTAGLVSSNVKVRETDLHILTSVDVTKEAENLVWQYRTQLENYINRNPEFHTSLAPLPIDNMALPIIRQMQCAAKASGVGPMAAVAGMISEIVGQKLINRFNLTEIMVENGGDIFLERQIDCKIAIFAGSSPLSNKVGIKISPEQMPLGICTSSATVGHSLSLGKADAVTVLSASTPLADAAATRLGNEVQKSRPLQEVLDIAGQISGITGVVIIRGEEIGAWGEIELISC